MRRWPKGCKRSLLDKTKLIRTKVNQAHYSIRKFGFFLILIQKRSSTCSFAGSFSPRTKQDELCMSCLVFYAYSTDTCWGRQALTWGQRPDGETRPDQSLLFSWQPGSIKSVGWSVDWWVGVCFFVLFHKQFLWTDRLESSLFSRIESMIPDNGRSVQCKVLGSGCPWCWEIRERFRIKRIRGHKLRAQRSSLPGATKKSMLGKRSSKSSCPTA